MRGLLPNAQSAGFSMVELLVVLVLVGGALTFLLTSIPQGLIIFNQSSQGHKLYYLAKEKVAEIRTQRIWIENVDTQNPRFPTRSNDLANQWKSVLDMDNRNFSNQVRGQITVILLMPGTYTPFSFFLDFWFTPRERYEIRISVTQGTDVVQLIHNMTITASEESLLGILHLIRRGLMLYAEHTGSYPPSNQLFNIAPNYIPYIPNDPYTYHWPQLVEYMHYADYSYTNDGTTRKLFALSHPESTYPNLVLTW